jgi:prepilin-type N-terminal cleavage/methylation domain-containing protein/prepilin-type processing-associated H-X9-DG protein
MLLQSEIGGSLTGQFQPENKRHLRAFTLVELLVVIVIVVVLAAIAFPMIGSVQNNARRTASASNLRQWASALLLFVAENNQGIPYEGAQDQPTWSNVGSSANVNSWFNALPPYANELPLREMNTPAKRATVIDGKSIFSSPGAALSATVNNVRPQFSYMMNSQIYASTNNTTAPSNSGALLIRMNLIPSPSKTIFMTETRVSEKDGPPGTSSAANQLARAIGRNNNISYRYGGRTNIIFLDGHLETVPSTVLFNNGLDPQIPGNQLPDYIWFPWELR